MENNIFDIGTSRLIASYIVESRLRDDYVEEIEHIDERIASHFIPQTQQYNLNDEYSYILYNDYLTEKNHLLEYNTWKYRKCVNEISKIFFNKSFEHTEYDWITYAYAYKPNNIVHFALDGKSFGVEWLKQLFVIINYKDSFAQSTNGSSLFSDKLFIVKNNVIARATIEINVCKSSSIETISRTIFHELKHIFTRYVEKIEAMHKDIEFRNQNSTSPYLNNIDFSHLTLEMLEKIKNNIVEYSYYTNYDEMRAKLENVHEDLHYYLNNLTVKEYLNLQSQSKISQILQNSPTPKIYFKAIKICKECKKHNLVIEYLNKTILDKASKAYNKNFVSSAFYIDFIINKLESFINKSGNILSMICNEINDKIQAMKKVNNLDITMKLSNLQIE